MNYVSSLNFWTLSLLFLLLLVQFGKTDDHSVTPLQNATKSSDQFPYSGDSKYYSFSVPSEMMKVTIGLQFTKGAIQLQAKRNDIPRDGDYDHSSYFQNSGTVEIDELRVGDWYIALHGDPGSTFALVFLIQQIAIEKVSLDQKVAYDLKLPKAMWKYFSFEIHQPFSVNISAVPQETEYTVQRQFKSTPPKIYLRNSALPSDDHSDFQSTSLDLNNNLIKAFVGKEGVWYCGVTLPDSWPFEDLNFTLTFFFQEFNYATLPYDRAIVSTVGADTMHYFMFSFQKKEKAETLRVSFEVEQGKTAAAFFRVDLPPTKSTYDYALSSAKNLHISFPKEGTWYVGVYAFDTDVRCSLLVTTAPLVIEEVRDGFQGNETFTAGDLWRLYSYNLSLSSSAGKVVSLDFSLWQQLAAEGKHGSYLLLGALNRLPSRESYDVETEEEQSHHLAYYYPPPSGVFYMAVYASRFPASLSEENVSITFKLNAFEVKELSSGQTVAGQVGHTEMAYFSLPFPSTTTSILFSITVPNKTEEEGAKNLNVGLYVGYGKLPTKEKYDASTISLGPSLQLTVDTVQHHLDTSVLFAGVLGLTGLSPFLLTATLQLPQVEELQEGEEKKGSVAPREEAFFVFSAQRQLLLTVRCDCEGGLENVDGLDHLEDSSDDSGDDSGDSEDGLSVFVRRGLLPSPQQHDYRLSLSDGLHQLLLLPQQMADPQGNSTPFYVQVSTSATREISFTIVFSYSDDGNGAEELLPGKSLKRKIANPKMSFFFFQVNDDDTVLYLQASSDKDPSQFSLYARHDMIPSEQNYNQKSEVFLSDKVQHLEILTVQKGFWFFGVKTQLYNTTVNLYFSSQQKCKKGEEKKCDKWVELAQSTKTFSVAAVGLWAQLSFALPSDSAVSISVTRADPDAQGCFKLFLSATEEAPRGEASWLVDPKCDTERTYSFPFLKKGRYRIALLAFGVVLPVPLVVSYSGVELGECGENRCSGHGTCVAAPVPSCSCARHFDSSADCSSAANKLTSQKEQVGYVEKGRWNVYSFGPVAAANDDTYDVTVAVKLTSLVAVGFASAYVGYGFAPSSSSYSFRTLSFNDSGATDKYASLPYRFANAEQKKHLSGNWTELSLRLGLSPQDDSKKIWYVGIFGHDGFTNYSLTVSYNQSSKIQKSGNQTLYLIISLILFLVLGASLTVYYFRGRLYSMLSTKNRDFAPLLGAETDEENLLDDLSEDNLDRVDKRENPDLTSETLYEKALRDDDL